MTPSGAAWPQTMETEGAGAAGEASAPAPLLAFPPTLLEAASSPLSAAAGGGDPLLRPIRTFGGDVVGRARLPAEIFGLPPRPDLMHRVVVWQENRRHKGQHKTQVRNEVSRTGKKIYKQKGTGGARHGSRRAAQFVGGAKAHGPVLHDRQTDLPKKIRKLGLAHALSDRASRGAVEVVDRAELETYKTRDLIAKLQAMGVSNALIVVGPESYHNLKLASGNIHWIDLLPVEGINVISILRRETLILTREALQRLGERYSAYADIEDGPATKVPTVRAAREPARGRAARSAIPTAERLQTAPSAAPNLLTGRADSPSLDGRAKLLLQPQGPSNAELRTYLRTLQSGAGADRTKAMMALRSANLHGDVTDEAVRRLLPLLVSDNRDEALEAAQTLCFLRFPKAPALRAKRLSSIMHEEGVEFVTYVDQVKASHRSGHVWLRARLSRTLPLTISGEPVTLEVPAWIEDAKLFHCRVSGIGVKYDTIEERETAAEAGDMHAVELGFDLVAKGDQELVVDFFADDRWLDRQTVTIQI